MPRNDGRNNVVRRASENNCLKHAVIITLALFLCACPPAETQNQVVLAPPPKLQFFDQNGHPLAFGCVYTYISRTTSPLATYTDFSGTTQNTNPIVLNAGGFPGGGSSGIWLQAGQAYTMRVIAQGGTNCAFGQTQYTIDGIGGGGFAITTVVPFSPSPTFVIQGQAQMFEMTLTSNAAANPLSAVGITPPSFVIFQLTQDSLGNHTWAWPSNVIGGSAIGLGANQVTTQTFVWNGTNATAVGPANIGNGSSFSFSPGYLVIPNANPTGTTLNTLTKLTGAPSTAVIAGISDSIGIQGITVGGAGVIGTALIQTGGNAQCIFDGATTADDYVQISSTVAGDCHDAGSTPPSSQSIGRVLSTNATGGTYGISLFGPEIQASANQTVIPNEGSTGTTLNTLTTLTGAPTTAIVAATTATNANLGICVANCGITGNATIQQTGLARCAFDNSTTAGDYVINSSVTAGGCHDLGNAVPIPSPQTIGRAGSTNSGAGTYPIQLFPPEVQLGMRLVYADGVFSGVSANTTANQVLKTYTFPANSLTQGKLFRLTTAITITPGGAGPPASAGSIGWGTTTALGTTNPMIAQGANASPYTGVATFTCLVVSVGPGGQASCTQAVTVTGAGSPTTTTNQQSISPNTTLPFVIGIQCTFFAASVSNTCSSLFFTVEQSGGR